MLTAMKRLCLWIKTTDHWFLSHRVWFLRGMVVALVFGCFAWWATGVLAATVVGIFAAGAAEICRSEIRSEDFSPPRWFRVKSSMALAVLVPCLLIVPFVHTAVLAWHSKHGNAVSFSDLQQLNAVLLLAVFGGAVGSLCLVPTFAKRKFESGEWGLPWFRATFVLLFGIACVWFSYSLLIDCLGDGRETCANYGPGVSKEELAYDHRPVGLQRISAGLVRAVSGGSSERYAEITILMSYVPFFGILNFGFLCVSHTLPPLKFIRGKHRSLPEQER